MPLGLVASRQPRLGKQRGCAHLLLLLPLQLLLLLLQRQALPRQRGLLLVLARYLRLKAAP